MPPNSLASSSSAPNPAALPTPRPPPTTTRASLRDVWPAGFSTRSVTRTRNSCSERFGSKGATATSVGVAGEESACTAWGATVISVTGARRTASSRRVPPHRWRVTWNGSPGSAATQFDAIGISVRAATWAITSLPRSLPAAITTVAPVDAMSWTMASAQASGA